MRRKRIHFAFSGERTEFVENEEGRPIFEVDMNDEEQHAFSMLLETYV